jgi:hypothetical protein
MIGNNRNSVAKDGSGRTARHVQLAMLFTQTRNYGLSHKTCNIDVV